MPSPNDNIIGDNVIAAIKGFQEEVKLHRDTVFRAINLLNHEVVSLGERFDHDDEARIDRQKQVDAKLEAIQRWQWIRLAVEVAAVLIVIAFIVGLRQ